MNNAANEQKALSMRTLQSRNKDDIARRDGFMVSPRLIVEQKDFNPRNYDTERTQAHIANIAAAYLAGEYVEPITVRVGLDNTIYIVEGHCRTLAMKAAMDQGWNPDKVKVNVFEGDEVAAALHISTSNNKLTLTASERARYYKGILDEYDLSMTELAQRIGKSSAHIGQCLKLLEMPEIVTRAIDEGKLSASQAIKSSLEYTKKVREVAPEGTSEEEIKAQGYQKLEEAILKAESSQEDQEAPAEKQDTNTGSKSEKPAKASKKLTAKSLGNKISTKESARLVELLRESASELENMQTSEVAGGVSCTMSKEAWESLNAMMDIVKASAKN